MAFETGTATNIADFFGKLSTFATANGWTLDHSAADRLFLTRSTVSVAFRWATTSPAGAGVYQHLAFINSGVNPGQHTNDSGQGDITASPTNAQIMAARSFPIPNTPSTYWFFESDTYVHVVVEAASSPQQFAHFGFGILTKFGTWTGGEYSYGWRRDSAGAVPVGPLNTFLLSGYAGFTSDTTIRPFVGTVHIEGAPNQTGGGRWGLTWAGLLANTGTDRAAVARENLHGGFQGGPLARSFARYGSAINNGLVPFHAIDVWYDDRALARWYPLGIMPDVRAANVANYSGGQEVVVGSDTWVLFPASQKTITVPANNTRNVGIAYRKVTV